MEKALQPIPENFAEDDNSLLHAPETPQELEHSTYYDYPELEDSEDLTISTSVPYSSLISQAMAGTGSGMATAGATSSIFSSISTGRQGTRKGGSGSESGKEGGRRGGSGRGSGRGSSSRGGSGEGGSGRGGSDRGGREDGNTGGTNNTGNSLKEWGELPPPIDGRNPEKTADFTLQIAAYLWLNW